MSHTTEDTLTIRAARTNDADEIRRLAALDSKAVPKGDLVVAERNGELIAAVPVDGGAPAIADPFVRTTAVVEMLAIRATQLRDAPPAQPTRLQRIEALFERPAVRVN